MYLFLDVWRGIRRVSPNAISALQASNKSSVVHLEDNSEFETRHLLHQLIEMCPPYIIQVHRSFAVNIHFVVELNENRRELILQNGEHIPIAQNRIKTFVQIWKTMDTANESIQNSPLPN